MPNEKESRSQKRHDKKTRGVNTRKKRADYDFDLLELDWVEELAYSVALNGYRVIKSEATSDLYEYKVLDGDDLVVSVVSPRNLNKSAFNNRKRRRRRRR